MVSYATTGDFVLYGLPAPSTVAQALLLQPNLDAASNEAEGYMQARSFLPIAGPPYPVKLVQVVCKIAAYNAMSSIGFNPESPNDVAVRMGYKDAIAWLQSIADGTLTPTWVTVEAATIGASDPPRGWYGPSGRIR